ncbi:hypothetical protein N665_0076s0231 [Sinapis alba]|nr:hypothetical protein N665_0076s0231 [Sinapis alba]
MMRVDRFLQPCRILRAPVMFVMLLSEKVKNDRDFSSSTCGDICPVNLLPANLIAVRFLHEYTVEGKSPVKLLFPRSRMLRLLNLEKSTDKVPPSRLTRRFSFTSLVQLARETGTEPVRLLIWSRRLRRLISLPISIGISPTR